MDRREFLQGFLAGGVVCTWPMAYKSEHSSRLTFLDWAKEALEMKRRLGV